MATITSIISKGSGPYGQPLRVKVLARGNTINYKGPDGSDRQSLSVAVCDGSSCCKMVCYDPSKFVKLNIDNTVVVREVIVKTEETPAYLVATRATKIFLAGGVVVKDEHRQQCQNLVNPPPAPTVTLSTALKSPVKQRSSIQGKIVQEDQVRTVKVRGNDVPIKTITLEDGTGKAKVTLWREASDVSAHAGDFVIITDVCVNMYKNEASLSTTGRSTVERAEAPVQTEHISVVAVCIDDGKAELLLEDDSEVSVPAELLAQVVTGDKSAEELTADGPVELAVTRRGSDVISVELIRV